MMQNQDQQLQKTTHGSGTKPKMLCKPTIDPISHLIEYHHYVVVILSSINGALFVFVSTIVHNAKLPLATQNTNTFITEV
jgi:hypothetical protein